MEPLRLSDKDLEKINQAVALITASLTMHYTIGTIAKKISMPEKKLKYAFMQIHGVGVFTYLRHRRLEKAKELIMQGVKFKDIVPQIGYCNETNFSKAFRKVYKQLPTEWRNKQLGKTG